MLAVPLACAGESAHRSRDRQIRRKCRRLIRSPWHPAASQRLPDSDPHEHRAGEFVEHQQSLLQTQLGGRHLNRARAADKWEQEHGEPAPDGFRRIRVHDLKHTFGRRLLASEENGLISY